MGYWIYSDEFIDAEIVRLKADIDEKRKEWLDGINWVRKQRDEGHTVLDDTDNTHSELRQLERKLEMWEDKKRKRAEDQFIRRITTFPEDAQITHRDLVYMSLCDSLADFARAMQKDGLSKTAILKDIKNVISQPEANWTDELVADFMKS